ncbi:hypothetical protein [Streptomyces sp. NPDC008121]|uniref:hypothetical protein n=1 Tax=Streptomyces sp. NPDC008121 TaxID=3364809 RepID=UPI0036E7041C
MRIARTAWTVALMSACMTIGLAGAASAGQPRWQGAAVSAGAAQDEAGTLGSGAPWLCYCTYNTVSVTNNTDKPLTLAAVTVANRPYEEAVLLHSNYGMWRPKAGDVLQPGKRGLYPVIHWIWNNPQVALEFKDTEGRSARYFTETWGDGGSTLTKDDRTYYKVNGNHAAPGQWTMISLANP